MDPISRLSEIFSRSEKPVAFIDFDGTIAKKDVIDQILEKFADRSWQEIEESWLSGRIGSRECLSRQFAHVRASAEELDHFLDCQEIDAGFSDLVDFFRVVGISVHIISDGFDYYIWRMLKKSGVAAETLKYINVWANRLSPHGQVCWKTEFPYFDEECGDGCATCKPAVMKLNNQSEAPSIFIGDGLSDRFAARAADIVFAKDKLSEFCLDECISQIPYTCLSQIALNLKAASPSLVSTSMEEPLSLIYAV